MDFTEKTFGRLGNKLFQLAALYKYAKMNKTDFYFQDPKWFEGCEEEIKVLFEQKGYPLDYVAVHVRRGDYVNNPFYVDLCQTDYYKKAMEQFSQVQFLVFSDDQMWCMNYFNQPDFRNYSINFHTGDELSDFNAMTRCKSQIIANSSFSFWCAYLNSNPNKIIIAPSGKNWYSDGVERTKCPESWVRI